MTLAARTSPTPRFPTLEGLRALSALGVLAYHAGTFSGLTDGPTAKHSGAGPWVQHLNVGVSVFFVLSGFLLFRPFVVAHLEGTRRPATRPYLVRRLVRIFPAYWAALLVSTWVIHLNLGDWWGHVRFYGLLQIYAGDTAIGGLAQAWSLCTELSFYLFLPIWAALLGRIGGSVERKLGWHYAGLALLYAEGVVFRVVLRSGHHAIGYAWLPANTDLFALGMALAVASASAQVRGRPIRGVAGTLGDLPAAAWLAALCCYAGVVSLRFPFGLVAPTVGQEVARQALFGIIAFLVVAPSVFGDQDRGLIRAFLRLKPVWALGVVSYGIYLWHLTAIDRLAHRLRGPLQPSGFHGPPSFWPLVAWSVLATVVVAVASWFVLERPLLRKVRSGAAHLSDPQVPQGPLDQGASPDVLESPLDSEPVRAPADQLGEEIR